MKLHLIYEDEFSDLDDTDVFGEPGYTANPGDRRYNNLTVRIGSKEYSFCRAKIHYDIDINNFESTWHNHPPALIDLKISNPFVRLFIIDDNVWRFDSSYESYKFGSIETGLWSESTGPLSSDQIKSVVIQIIGHWEDDEDNILLSEYELYNADRRQYLDLLR